VTRDRDDAGRPRNARPRDALGRPLPRGSSSGVERVPDNLAMSMDAALDLAERYLDDGMPFHAHEVLEALWKTRPESERDLWQGLAQIAVGLTHALRGNMTGARALLERGRDRVGRYRGDSHGLDIEEILAVTSKNLEGLDDESPPLPLRLRPRTHNSDT
jgi:hypothetical protein